MTAITRRDFVKISTAAGLGAAMGSFNALSAAPGTAASTGALAASRGPFDHSGKPRLLLSLAAYSFRRNFPMSRGKVNPDVPPDKATDLFKFVDYCVAHGCDGAELTSYYFTEESDDYLVKLRRHCFLRGMPISGTSIGNNFSFPKGPQLTAQIETTKKWIDRAALLGAPHIRVFAGIVPEDQKDFSRAKADKSVIAALEECADYAGKKGIFLGLENHDSINSAATLIPMVKAVQSPWLGINLDSGNFRTEDPYRDFAECVPYTVNVQFKVNVYDRTGGRIPGDLRRFTQLLRDGGYQGWVALEYEAMEDPLAAVPRILLQMQELFAE